jgi:hypothetical protein
MGLLGSILTSPGKGFMFALNQVKEAADRELYDETAWQQKLLENQMRFDMNEISQEVYEAQEETIMAQIDLINYLKNPFEGEENEEDDIEEEQEEYTLPQIILLQEPVDIEGIEIRPAEPAKQESKDGRVPTHN